VRRRAALATGIAMGLLACQMVFAAGVRQPGRVARIGILAAGSRQLMAQFSILEPFFGRLAQLGYVEGRNLAVEYRFADGQPERLPALAAELIRLKVDVILALGPAAARAAGQASSTVPVVFTLVGDAVAEGLVDNLARPRGNLTGVSISGGVEIVGKRIQLLKEAMPSIGRIAVLWNPGNPSHAAIMREMPAVAKASGVELRTLEVRRPEDFDALFASIARDRVDGAVVLEDVIIALRAKELTEFLAANRIPAIYGATEFVKVGGLMSYQTSFASVNAQAAIYVDRILKGVKASDLPVEEPTKFDLVINLRAAKALGLTIPQSLLLRADEVIQ